MDEPELTASELILKIQNKIKEYSEDKEEMLDTIKVFKPIIDWLCNILYAKIDPFPFYHKISIETS